MKKELFMRAISLMLAATCVWVCLHLPVTAVPAEGTTKLEFTQVDNRAVSAQITPAEFTQAEDASPYQATDVVRVSILLDGKSTLEAGYSTLGIAENASAMSYRRNLARRQEAMVEHFCRSFGGGAIGCGVEPDTGCQPDFCQCSVW